MPALATSTAQAAPVGQGFNLNASDLRFILKQIKIAERHADELTPANQCGTLVGPGPDQIPATGQGRELPWGLRTIDGTCNNLFAGQNNFGAADQNFPRLVPRNAATPRPAESGTSYNQTSGTVVDSQPRVISNLIVDQTATNPAAVEAAGPDAVPTASGAFFIPNVAPDVGLSAPYNSWFTLFGQFFDHGLDLVNKGGVGSVFVPLNADDPLFNPTPGSPNFMILTRATHPGNFEANNQTSPFVDQSQTYTSHPSHQVFLRAYEELTTGLPLATGGLITGPGGGMADWAAVKLQAASVLGIELRDADALSIPLLATDPYGRFVRGPNGYPQMVVPSAPGGLVEGNPLSPVTTAGATKTGHAFLDDIAHHAAPGTFDNDANPATPQVPQTPDADAGTSDDGLAGTYDDEMLNVHFIAGDGRVNENIGLTTVHHVFHSEHNRLVTEIDSMITNDVAVTPAEKADWRASRYTARDGSYDYGERLFQAARFVTEMEYQHLAFEEFIRKVQPLVNPFGEGGTGYNATINPAIKAEFAHAVYRFGHSMLTESVDRISAPGAPPTSNIDLLEAFLNPPSFLAGGLTPEQAAGNIVRGMTRQVGNELDELVTEALRNRLLGLPLDLATLNMARARDTGVPGLNAARRAFFQETSNSALTPYESWADFGFSIKHPKALNNFIAAYGTHPTITGGLAARRAAADALVYGTEGPDGILVDVDGTPGDESADNIANVPEDRYAFLNSTDAYANGPGGVTTSGVDLIDLWVGGLAERQMVFGGLLGPTFNYVFEGQMEDLQFGDRFYYLSRTAGLNMLTQLEGNSFSELIQRNTDVSGLPADSFSRPDLVFDVANLGTSGPILDDPATLDYNEAAELTRMPNGTIRYAKVPGAHVVFNGTDGNNRVWSGEGDDTIRGNEGNDWMEGGDGNDNHIGGIGDDILVDFNGDDTLKGGDGNDTLSSGQGSGADLNQGGRDNDFIIHGNDAAESFGGPGDDYVLGGAGDDTVFGDDGDDWLETGATVTGTGGGAFNLLQGDNGAPFQDDPNEPGHDVLIGYGGESDNDAEGGDDIMFSGPGIQRNEGMLGFDFVTHKSDPVPADSDMFFTGLLPPSVDTNRDRFDGVESLSGWNNNDILRGNDADAAAMGTDHDLDAAGSARVTNLRALIGATTFTGGNIIIGGAGSDLIEGRGGDDFIDGDAYLDASIDELHPTTGAVVANHNTMSGVKVRILNGTLNPGLLRIHREIITPANGAAVDTAVFSQVAANYDVTVNGDGTTTVAHVRGNAQDGIDTLRNIETLLFSDTAGATAPSAPLNVTATAGNAQATVSWTVPTSDGGSPITEYEVDVITGGAVVNTFPLVGQLDITGTSTVVTGLTNGTAYTFVVRATNAIGDSVDSAPSAAVTPQAPNVAPTVTARSPLAGATGVAVGSNITATFSEAIQGANATTVFIRSVAAPAVAIPAAVTLNAANTVVTLNPTGNLANNTAYTVTLTGGAAAIRDLANAPLVTVSWTFTTAPAANAAPTVTARTPAVGATGIAPAANLTATFSEAVQGVTAATFQVRNPAGTVLAGAVTAGPGVNQFSLNPTANLLANTVYTVTLTGGAAAIRDLANAPLVTVSWTFTTAPAANAAPTVTARAPAVGATGVGVAANVTATFSEAVQGVTAATFQLRNPAGTVLAGGLTAGPGVNQFVLNPTANLLPDTTYTVTLTGGAAAIRDTTTPAAPLVTVTWTFTTGPAPTVTARTPAVNATGVIRTANVTATLSENVNGVGAGTFQLRNPAGTVIAGVVTRNGATNQWILNPGVTLAANTVYQARLTGGAAAIRDLAGNPLVTSNWTFTTGP